MDPAMLGPQRRNVKTFGLALRATVHDLTQLIMYFSTRKCEVCGDSPIKFSLNRRDARTELVTQSIGRKLSINLLEDSIKRSTDFLSKQLELTSVCEGQLLVPLTPEQTLTKGIEIETMKEQLGINVHNTLLANSLLHSNKEIRNVLGELLRFELDVKLSDQVEIEPYMSLRDMVDQQIERNSWILTGLNRSVNPDSIKSWFQKDLEVSLDAVEVNEEVQWLHGSVYAHGQNPYAMNPTRAPLKGGRTPFKPKRTIVLNPVPKDDPLLLQNFRTPLVYLDEEFFFKNSWYDGGRRVWSLWKGWSE
jgi:hypothetical protein